MILKNTIFAICLMISLSFLTGELFLNPAVAATGGNNRCKKAELKLWEIKSLMQRKIFLEKATQECPDDAMLQYYYAVNLDRRQRYEKALHYYKLSAKLNSLYPYVYFGIGETYLSLGDITEAINAYKKGLKIQPDNKWGSKRIKKIITLKATPSAANAFSSVPAKTKQNSPTPNKYTKHIAERYGIRLENLIQAQKQMASLKEIADRYNLQLDTLIKKEKRQLTQTNLSDISKNADINTIEQEKTRKNYLGEISKRYGIQLDELAKANKQMEALQNMADRYGLQLDDLIKAYKNNSTENDRFTSIENEHITAKKNGKIPQAYLAEISKRYGIQLDELTKINDKIGSLKAIADRYGIQIDDLIQGGQQMALFENEKTIAKEHKVVENEYLSKIALRYGVDIEDLVKANKQISDPNAIFPGQIIKIPKIGQQ